MASLLDTIFSARLFKGGVEYTQRKTIEFIGAGVTIADDPVNERSQITIASGSAPTAHADTHVHGGGDALEGDRIQVGFEPVYYSRVPAPPWVTDADQLTAHLAGIDASIGTLRKITYVTVAGASHVFAIGDAYKSLMCTLGTAIGLVLPANATVPYEVGTVIAFVPMGAGQITLSGAVGVTLVSGGNELKSLRQYGPMFAQQTSANTWLVSGEKAA